MKPTVYVETTIVSYLTAWPSRDIIRLSHEIMTRDWWADERAAFDLYSSEYVLREASMGDPAAAQERLVALLEIPLLAPTPAVDVLSQRLFVDLNLPRKAALDAAHVAVSSAYGMQYLLTWNCTHLANGTLADKIEKACEAAGFKAPRILTPLS